MAFAGTFLSKIDGVTHGASSVSLTANLVTPAFRSHSQQQHPTSSAQKDNDDNNSNSHSTSTESEHNNNDHQGYTTANYPGVLDSDLTSLTSTQRHMLIVILAILFVLSMCGNVGTLFVNFRRKIRPFFRACLISLAFSDLMNTVFLTTAYMSQFTAEYVQIWRLGDLMCSLVPFATTTAILASSMTLVGIAVDRYFAVMKAVTGFWNPSLIGCIACVFCIWLTSTGIACPVFAIYDIITVYILKEEQQETATNAATAMTLATGTEMDAIITNTGVVIMASKKPSIKVTIRPPPMLPLPEVVATETKLPWQKKASLEDLSHTLVREQQLVNMCVSDQKNVTIYYVVVFVIIFIPCLGAFFWFNSIIARKLWKRRHVAAIPNRKTCGKRNNRETTIPVRENHKTDVPTKICCKSDKSSKCKTGHTSSTTVPSSLINTLGGRVTTTATYGSNINNSSHNKTNISREARHLRMFTIILIMMAVFVFLRLPAWIFLLMRMYGNYTKPIHWILYFVFGLMNLASSVLNPLFYTFLTETIHYTLKVKEKVKTIICSCYGKVSCCAENNVDSLALQAEHGEMRSKKCGFLFTYCCGYLGKTLCCNLQLQMQSQHQSTDEDNQLSYQQHEIQSKNSDQVVNSDKDEGVDCNDDIDDENVPDFNEYNHRIYTIFPPSLVSSSVNSQTS